MPLIVPKEGLLVNLDLWFGALPATMVVDLFQNDFTPDPDTVFADLILEDVNASPAPQALPVFGPAVIVATRAKVVGATSNIWTAAPGFTAQTVYGYLVYDTSTNKIWWCERFSTPFDFAAIGDARGVILTYTRRSEF